MLRKSILPIIFIFSVHLLFSQGFNMTLEGSWDNTSYEFNDCWGYTDEYGNEYAIMGSRTKVIFFDITTPTSPVNVGEFTGSFPGISGANSIWRDFKTYDRYAYAVADQGQEGLMVFDLSDIHNGNVSKVFQKNDKFKRAHNIFIDVPEGKLYIIGSNTQSNGLIVYDLGVNPSEPDHLASVSISGGYVHDAYVSENIAYCSSGYDGLYIIDMSTPASPVFKSSELTTAAGYNHSNWPFDNGNKMIVAEEVPVGLKLAIYDISDLNNITYQSSFRDPINTSGTGFPTYHNPYMVDDYAVISSYEDGITIMDLSNTSSPFRAAHYDTYTNTNYTGYEGCWGAYPYFQSGTIIGSDIETGLYVLSTTLNMTNTCSNGIKDDFEIDIDCGGFCNTCECSSPLDIVFTDISNSTLQIDWPSINTAVGYEVRYRESVTTAWSTVSSSINMVTISGLSSLTNYEFQFRSDCGNRLTPFGTKLTYLVGACNRGEFYTGAQGSGTFTSMEFIKSEANILPGSSTEYLTGDSIILQESFFVDLNTDFLAKVDYPCGIASFTGQNEIQKYTKIEPPIPTNAFELIKNINEGMLYLLCNNPNAGTYRVSLHDKEGRVIQKTEDERESNLMKFAWSKDHGYLHITQNEKTYKLLIN